MTEDKAFKVHTAFSDKLTGWREEGGALQIVHARSGMGASGDKKVWGTYRYWQEHLESRRTRITFGDNPAGRRGAAAATQTLLSRKLTERRCRLL